MTGLLPALHPNTVIFSVLPILLTVQTEAAAVFLVAIAVTHSMLDFIPSILTGVPDTDSILAALPGKTQLLNGNGFEAIHATFSGGIAALVLACLIVPVCVVTIPVIAPYIDPVTPYLISALFFATLAASKDILAACKISLLAGGIGLVTLNLTAVNTTQALFPLLTGLFGIPVLLTTWETPPPPDQDHRQWETVSINRESIVGAGAGLVAGFMPGIGPSAVIGSVDRQLDDHTGFLTALGGMNTADSIVSLVMLYTVGDPRSGAAVGIQKLTAVTTPLFVTLIGVALVAGSAAVVIGNRILPWIVSLYQAVPHKPLTVLLIAGVTALTAIQSGLIGIGILLTATGIGWYSTAFDVRRTVLMACLFVPVLLHYL